MERITSYPKTNTPWGVAQIAYNYGRGMQFYSTAGHGGFHLSGRVNEAVPEYMRQANGWYEEDCEWAVVATVYPDMFDEKERETAKTTLRNYKPEAYELFYGVILKPGESHVKDDRLFREAHQNDYLVLAARSAPNGMAAVFAGRGGRTENYHYPSDTKWFLVNSAEYNAVNHDRFVIDPAKHKEIPEPK